MWAEIFAKVPEHVAFIVRIYLLGGDVLATIAVGAGIVWESGPLEVQHIAHRLVIWGIVAEALCTIALFTFDDGLSDVQAAIIRTQNSKIITLETNLQQATDVLLWQQMPRQITQITQCRKELAASPRGAKVKIVWRSDVSDGDSFAFFLSTCFSDPEHFAEPPKWDVKKPEAVTDFPKAAKKTGVTVISNSVGSWLVKQETPADFIARALFDGVMLNMGIDAGYDPGLPDGVVVIAIGQKLP